MRTVFSAVYLFGFFLFMFIFLIVAVITAKHKISWVFYAVGVVWQFYSLSGLQRESVYTGTNTIPYWITYGFLIVLAAALIILRKRKTKEKDKEPKDSEV